MIYSCWGAAKQVTGSMHLLTLASGVKLLIDCGLDYEDRNDSGANVRFPFNPKDIDVMLLTHAHIDHSGNIPNLVKQGFQGSIYCTEPTAYHLESMWVDSVNIQNKKSKKGKPTVPKLFGYGDIKKALELIKIIDFYDPTDLQNGFQFEFYEAGHIIGAASVLLTVTEGDKTTKIGFTGDLGNYESKLIVNPKPMPNLEYLVSESTYGSRLHQETRTPEETIKAHVIENCVKRPGRLIIPAFSVGRTQAILFTLKKLMLSGELPPIRVYTDSPLALASTQLHNRFSYFLNQETKQYVSKGEGLFEFSSLYTVEDKEDEEEMNFFNDACIIVSSAGMLEGGRIQSHVQNHIQNPLCTILIAGFCAPGTFGAKLLSGIKTLSFNGVERPIYASIAQTDVFSAHPDANGLLRYFSDTLNPNFKRLFFVHGDEISMTNLKVLVEEKLSMKVVLPEKGQVFDL